MVRDHKINLNNVKNIHMIGIGGSGIFPIAKILSDKGFYVSGSDSTESETTQRAENSGIKVFIGHNPENVDNADLVVFSAAIKENNPEIQRAREKGIPCLQRSTMLGIITDEYKNSVAVSGTHGKTSTTSMITHILLDSHKEPTAIIGGTLPRIRGNSCMGKSDIIVCEACEYVDSFLELHPRIAIILNVDADHLDYFKSIEGVKSSFSKFAEQTKDILIVNGDDGNACECAGDAKCKKIYFGLSDKNDYHAKNIQFDEFQAASFDLFYDKQFIVHVDLNIPGKHNVYNAMAAIIVCLELGVRPGDISESIKTFKGAHRRFEILDTVGAVTIADDFAHHPSEIEATLTAAKSMNFKRVILVFQPHTFSRTFMFLDEFAKSLSLADRVILTDILPVREVNTYDIYSEDLGQRIENCICVGTFDNAASEVLNTAKPGDLVLTMGGGNIYKCANMIVSEMKNKFRDK